MKYIKYISLKIVALMLFSKVALADGTASIGVINEAAKRSGDESRQGLVAILGNIVNDPLSGSGSGDTILASIFQVMNGAILIIAAFYACYWMFKKISSTAHDGSIFNRNTHILFGPIKLILAIAFLVPLPSGWSLAQLIMLWSASSMGVGLANLGVDAAISAFSNGQSMVVQPAMPSTVALAHSVFENNLCMHGINAGLAATEAAGGLVPSNAYVQQSATITGYVLKNNSFICGGADINNNLNPQSQSTNWFSATIDVSDIRQAHLQALKNMQNTLNSSAQNYVNAVVQKQNNVNANVPDVEVIIQQSAQQYELSVNNSVGKKQGNIASLASKVSDNIKQKGWWLLGAWYQTFAQANTKLSDAVAAKASVYGMSKEGDPAVLDTYEVVIAAYKAQQEKSTYTPPSGIVTNSDFAKGANANDASQVIGSIFSAPGQRFLDLLVNQDFGAESAGQINPLIKMKNVGDYTLGLANALVTTIAVVENIDSLGILSKLKNYSHKFKDFIDTVRPILSTIILTFFCFGGVLSTYLPLIPFILWMGGIVNWLVHVAIGIVAAPLWAFSHLLSDEEGLGQATTYGYTYMLSMMLRPVLMVIGFFFGGAIVIVAGTFLNKVFGIAIANAQFDSLTGITSIIFFLAIYASVCVNLIHSAFNLIFIIPDSVISWIGNLSSISIGQNENEKTQIAIGSFSNRMENTLPRMKISKSVNPNSIEKNS